MDEDLRAEHPSVNGVVTKAKPKNHWKKGAEIEPTNKLLEALCEGRKYLDVCGRLFRAGRWRRANSTNAIPTTACT